MGKGPPRVHAHPVPSGRRQSSQGQGALEGNRGGPQARHRGVREGGHGWQAAGGHHESGSLTDSDDCTRDHTSIMAKGRELKGRIKSVENTRKITRTMEMVATSKMKRAQDRVAAARPYAESLREVLASLYSPELAGRFPLLRQPAQVKRAAVILLTGNRGLAGAFNANLIKEARSTINRLEGEGVKVDLHAIGKKGLGYFRYVGRNAVTSRIDIGEKPTADHAAEIINDLVSAFSRGELDAVYVVFPNFKSVLTAPPTSLQILPVTP